VFVYTEDGKRNFTGNGDECKSLHIIMSQKTVIFFEDVKVCGRVCYLRISAGK
jgi:hypothetical protein